MRKLWPSILGTSQAYYPKVSEKPFGVAYLKDEMNPKRV